MARLTSLCVYCGASPGQRQDLRETAGALGAALATRAVKLIYGGGQVGIMGILADAVLAAGGEAIGVIPDALMARELGHKGATELRVVENMHVRKQQMFDLADAFAILPGGLGTLEEAFEIITWKQLGMHDKPIVLLDVNDYWRPFGALVDHVIDTGFARPQARELFTVAHTTDALFAAIDAAPEPTLHTNIDTL